MLTIHLHTRFFAFHGLFDEEQKLGNEFDVEVKVEQSESGLIKDINQTIDYTKLYQLIENKMRTPYSLLETFATEITQEILDEFKLAQKVYFHITKLHPPFTGIEGTVGVSHTRVR